LVSAGATNINYLNEHGVTIWDEWANEEVSSALCTESSGAVAGTRWQNDDQISQLISQIKKNPNSRRLIVSAWNVADVEKMALPPCHTMFQFTWQTESSPVNCISAAQIFFSACRSTLHRMPCSPLMIAQVCDLKAGDFVHTFGDAHIYLNHLEQSSVATLSRTARASANEN